MVLDPFTQAPVRVEFEGKAVDFGRCNPAANHRRRRATDHAEPEATAPFDPIAALLAKARQENA